MYNHLKHTLQIVEELHQVTLENAYVASKTSVCTPEPEHANEDEDKSITKES